MAGMRILLALLLALSCIITRSEDTGVLKSKLAGSWYTANPEQLRKQIAGYVKDAGKKRFENVIALIMPHAGYRYAGPVAGYAVKELTGGKYFRVIIIGPSHYKAFFNQLSVPDINAYETPLGQVKLDTDFINKLKKFPWLISRTEYHSREHSIQIELPYLQYAIPGVKVVPLLVGQIDLPSARKIAKDLLSLVDKETLILISSDFTHYGRRFSYTPFGMNFQTGDKIRGLDLEAFGFVKKKDLTGFMNFIEKTQATICGRCGIAILTAMLPANAKVHLLKYDTSAATTGFNGESVSYLAAAVTGQWEPAKIRKVVSMTFLSPETRKSLLLLARKTIKSYLDKQEKPTLKDLGITLTPDMNKTLGAFVTLHKNGNLRGCIGNYPRKGVPLYQVVMEMARAAAFSDPRFRPLRKNEFKDIDIEISVLTQPKPVKSWKDIVLDRDGIILRKGWNRAVFLPQVAPEQDWTLEETLSYLSRKAGLPVNAWKEGAKFEVFQADVFGEKKEK
jgi:hypothetical protein